MYRVKQAHFSYHCVFCLIFANVQSIASGIKLPIEVFCGFKLNLAFYKITP